LPSPHYRKNNLQIHVYRVSAIGRLPIGRDGPAKVGVDDGWWEAIVVARDGDMLTLKWRDYPLQANAVQHAGAVALLKPTPVNT
jgi:hypothetical protein